MLAPLTHLACEHRDGMECESCNELTQIEAQLEELYERHRKARVKRNYFHSPLIHRFPLEIVTSVFLFAFPPQDSCPWCSSSSEHASPLVLTKVCHTWRALALSSPRLWSFISFDAEKPNFPLWNHQITHSGVVPLSVYFLAESGSQVHVHSTAKQAMSLVIKNLHRIASLYLHFTNDVAMICGFIPDLDYPKTAPLLKKLHFHCLDDAPSSSFRLRLAIEPPRPREVLMNGISFNQLHLNWTSVSSLTLVSSDIQILSPALDSLKTLVLSYSSWDLSTEQPPVVNQSIQDVIHEASDPAEFMLTMTLPSLRTLDVDIDYVETLTPITCDFMRRSLCPLQVLTINYTGIDDGGRVIQALIDVLEITTVLQHLTLILWTWSFDKFPSSGFEPLVRRFSSGDTGFLPCLRTLSLDTRFIPPIDLLLDAMASNPPSEIPNGPNVDTERPLRTLDLGLNIPLDEVKPIQQDVLVRILQMREAGKKISITCQRVFDLVEHWKKFYGSERTDIF